MFAKALHSLAKIGEDLYLEPRVEGLSMRTMNSARSAFLTYSFCSSFFDEFVPPPEELLKEGAVPSSMGSEGSQAGLVTIAFFKNSLSLSSNLIHLSQWDVPIHSDFS